MLFLTCSPIGLSFGHVFCFLSFFLLASEIKLTVPFRYFKHADRDDVRALSSRIFYDSYSHNFDLIMLSGKRHFNSKNSAHIYDAERNENFLSGDGDF